VVGNVSIAVWLVLLVGIVRWWSCEGRGLEQMEGEVDGWERVLMVAG